MADARSGELHDRADELARRSGATLFMVLLAAFQTLLFRYSNQEQILVGSPFANRGRTGTEGIIGLFRKSRRVEGKT